MIIRIDIMLCGDASSGLNFYSIWYSTLPLACNYLTNTTMSAPRIFKDFSLCVFNFLSFFIFLSPSSSTFLRSSFTPYKFTSYCRCWIWTNTSANDHDNPKILYTFQIYCQMVEIAPSYTCRLTWNHIYYRPCVIIWLKP